MNKKSKYYFHIFSIIYNHQYRYIDIFEVFRKQLSQIFVNAVNNIAKF